MAHNTIPPREFAALERVIAEQSADAYLRANATRSRTTRISGRTK